MQNVMIISKWELRQGFINSTSSRNVALHEFVHLIDLMDGTLDGVPEILLERKYVAQWLKIVNSLIMQIKTGESDIDFYGATNQVEFFAVVSEYFFEQPRLLKENHREVYEMLEKIIDMDTKLILLIITLIVVAGIVFYFLYRANKRRREEMVEPIKTFEQKEIEFDAELRHEYSSALQSGDKEKALALGKKYYQSLRGGEPTSEDEQAIFNDLSTMKKV
jgi:hypothetical protein